MAGVICFALRFPGTCYTLRSGLRLSLTGRVFMQRKNVFIASILPGLLLGGCVTSYAPNDGTPTAQVRYTTNAYGRTVTNLFRLDLDSCGSTPRVQRVADDKTRLSDIAANEPFIFSAFAFRVAVTGSPGYECRVYGRFEPVAGMNYEVSFDVQERRCGVDVMAVEMSRTRAHRTPELTYVPYQVPRTFGGGTNAKALCELAFPE